MSVPKYELYGLQDDEELAHSLLFRIVRGHQIRHGKRPTEITVSGHLYTMLEAEGMKRPRFAGIPLQVTNARLRPEPIDPGPDCA